jgi:hypothetical protein
VVLQLRQHHDLDREYSAEKRREPPVPPPGARLHPTGARFPVSLRPSTHCADQLYNKNGPGPEPGSASTTSGIPDPRWNLSPNRDASERSKPRVNRPSQLRERAKHRELTAARNIGAFARPDRTYWSWLANANAQIGAARLAFAGPLNAGDAGAPKCDCRGAGFCECGILAYDCVWNNDQLWVCNPTGTEGNCGCITPSVCEGKCF